MAELKVQGYVNQPKMRESAKGGFATFTIAERVKQKDGSYTRTYYDCVDFKNPLPPESSFVKATGWFNTRTYTKKDGTQGTGLSLNVQSLEIAPPRDGANVPDPTKNFDDLPF